MTQVENKEDFEEKKSLNFIEQAVEAILRPGRTGDGLIHASRRTERIFAYWTC